MSEAKCHCQHCNGHLSFEPEHAGTVIPCPHCGMETKLFIAPSPGAKAATIVKPAWTPPPKAKIEDTMETIGETFFYMGIFGAVVFGIGAFAAFISHEQPLVGVSLVLIAIISLAQGFIVQALFLWCGEVIRLLRANKR